MNRHTPGPWAIIIDGTCSGAWPFIVPAGTDVDDCGEAAIAELPTTHVERDTSGFPGTYSEKPERFTEREDHDEIMANARLIAAAPELLALAQYVASDHPDYGDMVSMAHNVLAKLA